MGPVPHPSAGLLSLKIKAAQVCQVSPRPRSETFPLISVVFRKWPFTKHRRGQAGRGFFPIHLSRGETAVIWWSTIAVTPNSIDKRSEESTCTSAADFLGATRATLLGLAAITFGRTLNLPRLEGVTRFRYRPAYGLRRSICCGPGRPAWRTQASRRLTDSIVSEPIRPRSGTREVRLVVIHPVLSSQTNCPKWPFWANIEGVHFAAVSEIATMHSQSAGA